MRALRLGSPRARAKVGRVASLARNSPMHAAIQRAFARASRIPPSAAHNLASDAAHPPTKTALPSSKTRLAHDPRTQPRHHAAPGAAPTARAAARPPARQRRAAHSTGRAAPPELADPSNANVQRTHRRSRLAHTRALNTTILAAATARNARHVTPPRSHAPHNRHSLTARARSTTRGCTTRGTRKRTPPRHRACTRQPRRRARGSAHSTK